jgi:hypothetical protein
MIWVRKVTVFVLSVVLFICLVAGTLSFSANLNLGKPAKLESWLNNSDVYTSLVNNELSGAQQNASNDAGAGRVSLNDPTVANAVKSIFSPAVVSQYAATFLNSNYAWLQGKTTQPDFRIDLTSTKQQLADRVGQAVETRVAGLQPCTSAELDQIQATLSSDPLTLPCGLPGLDATTAGQQVTKQIASSSDFLNNPVLTAATLNPNGSSSGQPYYQRLARLPQLYRLNQKLPVILGILALLSIIGILVLSLTRRRALRRLGWVFLADGVILIAFKSASDGLFNQVQKKLFSNSNVDQLQKSLTGFMHQVESQFAKTELITGVVLLVLALLILLRLWFTRGKTGGPKPKSGAPEPVKPGTVFKSEPEEPAILPHTPRPPVPPLKRPPVPTTRPPTRPRLIQ